MPPAVERAQAVWREGRLVAVLLEGGGPLYGPAAGNPLKMHPAFRGRLREDLPALLPLLDEPDALEALRRAGYEVRPTPRSALTFAL